MTRGIFIAATGQHVGKTTLCLGILAGLKKRFKSIGFLKPVGQEKIEVDGAQVDKDAVLFRKYFQIGASLKEMSPVICSQGFTKKYLDKEISEDDLIEQIDAAWRTQSTQHDFMLVEGTGHVGVGSLFNLNNARVAKKLGLDLVLIATGGLGASFDELSLNIEMCKSQGVRVKGVILNKVFDDKRGMILNYFPKALQRLQIPLIGCIPYAPMLLQPSMHDFESLFSTKMLCGDQKRFGHFQELRLVAGSLDSFVQDMKPNQLVITPACREDVIIATVGKQMRLKHDHNIDFQAGLLLTEQHPPRKELIDRIQSVDIPVLYTPDSCFDVMKMISSFTSKISFEDSDKIHKAINLVEEHIDFEALCG